MRKKKKIFVPRFKEEEGFYTTTKNSNILKQVKSNSKPEIKFRKKLWAFGIRYRINTNNLPGKPDVSIKKYKIAIFIDGDFWHGFNWEIKKERIKSNRNYWIPKIERNMQRDKENNEALNKMGFKVFRFWEHQIKKDLSKCIEEVVKYINCKKEKS